MTYIFLGVGLAIALLDWVAVVRQWKALELIAKPAVMLALLAWLWSVSSFSGFLTWFAVGLAFSMAGDVFLVLPKEQFIAGLVAFLLAQIAYLIGFNATPPPINLASIAIAVLVGLAAVRIYRAIAVGLTASGHGSLKMPVLVYSAAISLMLLSALLTLVRSEWAAGPAWLVSIGATLFFISDSLLAWNKFVRTLRIGRLPVIVTYHLGQGLIVLGAVMHFIK